MVVAVVMIVAVVVHPSTHLYLLKPGERGPYESGNGLVRVEMHRGASMVPVLYIGAFLRKKWRKK